MSDGRRLFLRFVSRAQKASPSQLTEWIDEAEREHKMLSLEIEILRHILVTMGQGETDQEGGSLSRKMRISDGDLLALMAELGTPLSPTPLKDELERRGVKFSREGVRYRLRQLVEKGHLQETGGRSV